MGTWTVVLHFDRGHSETFNDLSLQQAKEMIDIAVFKNKDCVNASIFQTL